MICLCPHSRTACTPVNSWMSVCGRCFSCQVIVAPPARQSLLLLQAIVAHCCSYCQVVAAPTAGNRRSYCQAVVAPTAPTVQSLLLLQAVIAPTAGNCCSCCGQSLLLLPDNHCCYCQAVAHFFLHGAFRPHKP